MLTSLFYFGHYRSFAARTTPGRANYSGNQNAIHTWPAKNITPRTAGENAAVLLNKADNSKVVNFARTLSTSIVGLKDAAKMFVHDVNLINANGTISFETHHEWIEEDLENFVNSYNRIQHLSSNPTRTSELSHLAHYFRNFAQSHGPVLSHLGVITYNENSLTYHGSVSTSSREAAQNAVDTFKTAYSITKGFLERPLAHHMEFRDLGYYYNYTIGDAGTNTFSLIQSGMLVDVLV